MEGDGPAKQHQRDWRTYRAIARTPRNIGLAALIFVGAVNFISFMVVAGAIGGDAVNGRIEGGRYLLADHGRLHDVSKAVFTYSFWHARSLFLTHPLAILAGWLLVRDMRRTRKGTPSP